MRFTLSCVIGFVGVALSRASAGEDSQQSDSAGPSSETPTQEVPQNKNSDSSTSADAAITTVDVSSLQTIVSKELLVVENLVSLKQDLETLDVTASRVSVLITLLLSLAQLDDVLTKHSSEIGIAATRIDGMITSTLAATKETLGVNDGLSGKAETS